MAFNICSVQFGGILFSSYSVLVRKVILVLVIVLVHEKTIIFVLVYEKTLLHMFNKLGNKTIADWGAHSK